jgi:hypothetical protein
MMRKIPLVFTCYERDLEMVFGNLVLLMGWLDGGWTGFVGDTSELVFDGVYWLDGSLI